MYNEQGTFDCDLPKLFAIKLFDRYLKIGGSPIAVKVRTIISFSGKHMFSGIWSFLRVILHDQIAR